MVGLRGLHCDADQLPGGGKPAHHQDESVRQQVVHRGRIEHRLDRVEMGVGKVADVARQPIRDVRERVPRLEDPVEVAKVLERPRGADLTGEAPPRFLFVLRGGERPLDVLGYLLLEGAGHSRAGRGVISRRAHAPPLRCRPSRGRERDRGRSRPRSAPATRAIRPRCLYASTPSTRNGSIERKNSRAGSAMRGAASPNSRTAQRTSCRRRSPPGTSVPLSDARSSSATSRARPRGESCRRYCRNRSTGCPASASPHHVVSMAPKRF